MIEADKSPLEGLTVLDIGHYISGPYCTKLMAALGATVIKVEPPCGDAARRLGPFPNDIPHLEKSGQFQYLNTGKQGVTLNLKTEQGRDILLRLAARADVVVENFEPRVLPSLGLDYERLHVANRRLVLTSISNFGQSGPYRDYKADEIGIHAISGLMDISGEPGRPPLKKGGNFAQYHGAVNALSATMTALFLVEDAGGGRHVDVSLAESFSSMHGRVVKIFSFTGDVVRREGSHGRSYPAGIYRCADGYVAFTSPMGREWWDDFVEMVGAPELGDARFQDPVVRANSADELDAYFLPWLSIHTKDEIYRMAHQHRMPAGPIATATDLFDSPQLLSRGFLRDVELVDGERMTLPGLPYHMAGVALPPVSRAPGLGEHNEEVYGGMLGLSRKELGLLCRESVI